MPIFQAVDFELFSFLNFNRNAMLNTIAKPVNIPIKNETISLSFTKWFNRILTAKDSCPTTKYRFLFFILIPSLKKFSQRSFIKIIGTPNNISRSIYIIVNIANAYLSNTFGKYRGKIKFRFDYKSSCFVNVSPLVIIFYRIKFLREDVCEESKW